MANKSYDLFAGGLDEVIKDLQIYERDLIIANDIFTQRLAVETVETIKALAMSSDGEEMADIINSNIIQRFANGQESVVRVVNTSQNATYSEFGYGIVGAGSEIDTKPFTSDEYGAEAIGKWNYDVRKHGLKGWWYPNRFGTPTHSIGQIPRRTIYRSYLSVLGNVGSYANSVFSKLKLGGN